MSKALDNVITLTEIRGTTMTQVSPLLITDYVPVADRNARLQFRRTELAPVGIVPMIFSYFIGKGDNTTQIGISNGYLEVADDASVDSSTKGCLYGLQVTCSPKVSRNNTPYDDVAALVIANGSSNGAMGTDAVYIGRFPTTFPGLIPEWGSSFTSDANSGYGVLLQGANKRHFEAKGKLIPDVSAAGYGVLIQSELQDGLTNLVSIFQSHPSAVAVANTLSRIVHYDAGQGTYGAGYTINDQFGFLAESTLTGATNNYGFYGNISAGTGRWNFYAGGTAPNFFQGDVVLNLSTSATPTVIGTMMFELTSDNSLTVKVKGSDGTVRSATLVLA